METAIKVFDTPPDRSRSDAEKYQKRLKLFGTHDLYPMWVADMEFEVAPNIKAALQDRVAHGIFGYSEPDLELFEIASQWMRMRHNVQLTPDHYRASPSIMTTMSAAIEALSNLGEGVTVLTPIYPPFLETVTSQGRVLHGVELLDTQEGYRIDWEVFEAALKKSRLFLLCNPHNPVGRVWTVEELTQMAQLCMTHGVRVISDDAHADITRSTHTYHHIATCVPQIAHETVTLYGPGKGFNVSGLASTLYFSANEKLLHAIDDLFHTRHVVRGQLMGYTALKAAFTQATPWLDAVNLYLDDNIASITTQLNGLKGARIYETQGTYLVWINCRAWGFSDFALKKFFVQQCKVGPSLGRLFGLGGSGCVRLNCAVPKAMLEEVVQRIIDAVNTI